MIPTSTIQSGIESGAKVFRMAPLIRQYAGRAQPIINVLDRLNAKRADEQSFPATSQHAHAECARDD
jgi:hypothetical protein